MRINNRKALSLVEVLIATVIISIAMYGMVLSFSVQQVAQVRLRERQVMGQLLDQYYKEILAGLRKPIDDTPSTIDDGSWSQQTVNLKNPALNFTNIRYSDKLNSIGGGGTAPYALRMRIEWNDAIGTGGKESYVELDAIYTAAP